MKKRKINKAALAAAMMANQAPMAAPAMPPAPPAPMAAPGGAPMKKGGKVKCMSKGGSASSRADGIASKGKTKGRLI